MKMHPANLTLRFLLELTSFGAAAVLSFRRTDGVWRWLLAILVPLVMMTLWGVFAVPDDPSRGGRPVVVVPGAVRLCLELAVFAVGIAALRFTGYERAAWVMLGLTLLHHALSVDRIKWLLAR